MRSSRWLAVPVGLIVLLTPLVLVPMAAGTVVGTGTSCSGFLDCKFTITDSKGTGWAQTFGSTISFQLPGEAKATTGVPYTCVPGYCGGIYGGTYIVKGTFAGTDVNTEKVVYGSTVTNITVTVHCQRGCSDTWVLNSGNVTFRLTKADATTTQFSCAPSSITSGGKTVCHVTVVDQVNGARIPNGTVKLSTLLSGVGKWSPGATCTLVSGSCSVTWTAADETVGTITMYAHYNGNSYFYKSYNTTYTYVTAPP